MEGASPGSGPLFFKSGNAQAAPKKIPKRRFHDEEFGLTEDEIPWIDVQRPTLEELPSELREKIERLLAEEKQAFLLPRWENRDSGKNEDGYPLKIPTKEQS